MKITFTCTADIIKRLKAIVIKRKVAGENCSVSELLRKGAIHIIKKDKEEKI